MCVGECQAEKYRYNSLGIQRCAFRTEILLNKTMYVQGLRALPHQLKKVTGLLRVQQGLQSLPTCELLYSFLAVAGRVGGVLDLGSMKKSICGIWRCVRCVIP